MELNVNLPCVPCKVIPTVITTWLQRFRCCCFTLFLHPLYIVNINQLVNFLSALLCKTKDISFLSCIMHFCWWWWCHQIYLTLASCIAIHSDRLQPSWKNLNEFPHSMQMRLGALIPTNNSAASYHLKSIKSQWWIQWKRIQTLVNCHALYLHHYLEHHQISPLHRFNTVLPSRLIPSHKWLMWVWSLMLMYVLDCWGLNICCKITGLSTRYSSTL